MMLLLQNVDGYFLISFFIKGALPLDQYSNDILITMFIHFTLTSGLEYTKSFTNWVKFYFFINFFLLFLNIILTSKLGEFFIKDNIYNVSLHILIEKLDILNHIEWNEKIENLKKNNLTLIII